MFSRNMLLLTLSLSLMLTLASGTVSWELDINCPNHFFQQSLTEFIEDILENNTRREYDFSSSYELFEGGQIKEISCFNLRESFLTPKLGQLKSLTALNLRNSNFHRSSLPTELGLLTNLKSLDLRNSNFSGPIPQLGLLTNLETLRLDGNQLTGPIPVEISKLTSLREVSLSNNNLKVTCDGYLLSWYPQWSDVIIDRNDIVCDDSNSYGELRLNPHLLRFDNNNNYKAPLSHALIRHEDVEVTAHSILLIWSYDGTDLNDIDIQYNADDFSIDDLLQENTYQSLIRCETFRIDGTQALYYDHGEIRLSGFEITWNENRICIPKYELSSDKDGDYSFNITTHIAPATEYKINIRPFHYRIREQHSEFIFGINSKSLQILSEDALPIAGPTGVRLAYRADTFLSLEWNVPLPSVSNGVVSEYYVECVECKTRLYRALGSTIIINELEPMQEYSFRVSAINSAGQGPFSNRTIVQTCSPNSFSTESSNGKCKNAELGFFFSEFEGQPIPCSSFINEIDQESCVRAGGSTASELVLRNGYWRPNVDSIEGINACPNPEFCTNNNTTSSDRHCTEHHTGVYCSECVDGYTFSSSGCALCDKDGQRFDRQKAILCGLLLALLILLYELKIFLSAGIFQALCTLKGKFLQSSNMKFIREIRQWFSCNSTKLKIFIVNAQILLSFQRTLSLKTTEKGNGHLLISMVTLQFDDFFSVFDFSCYMEVGFYEKLIFATLFPLAIVIFIWVVYALVCLTFLESTKKEALYKETFAAFLLVTFYIYGPVSKVIVDTFLCETILFESGGVEYLRADYRLSCDSTDYTKYSIYSSIMLILYPIGILFFYIYLLQDRRQIFFKKSSQPDTLDESSEEKLKLVRFLTEPYKDRYYWFEICELMRRLLLNFVSVIATLEDSRVSAETYALLVLMMSIVILEINLPYKDNGNWLYSLLCLLVLCLVTQIRWWLEFHFDGVESLESESNISERAKYEAEVYSLFLLVLFLMLVLFLAFDLFMRYRSTRRPNNPTTSKINLFGPISSVMVSCEEVDMETILQQETNKFIKKMKNDLKNKDEELRRSRRQLEIMQRKIETKPNEVQSSFSFHEIDHIYADSKVLQQGNKNHKKTVHDADQDDKISYSQNSLNIV